MRRSPRLAHRSPLQPGVDSGHGYQYAVRLSDAIETVLATRGREQLTLAGIDFMPAIQRQLYLDLINRPELYAAFSGASSGDRVGVAHGLEADVVQEVAPGTSVEHLERPALVDLAANVRHRARGRSATRGASSRVVALAIHPKMSRFLEPVVSRIPGAVVAETFGGGAGLRVQPKWGRRPPLALRPYAGLIAYGRAFDELLRLTGSRVAVAAEGSAPLDAVFAAVARARGNETVVLQQGWAPHVHAGFRSLPFDRMLVWGAGFADALAPANPALRFVAVGSHVIDAPVEGGRRDAVSVFLQTSSELISDEHVDRLVRLAGGLAPHVLVREHPGHALTEAQRGSLQSAAGVELVDPARVPLAEVLARSAVAVSIYSTTLYEAVAAGAVPVSFNPTSLPGLSPSLSVRGVGFEERNEADVRSVVGSLLDDPGAAAQFHAARDVFVREFFVALGDEAAGRASAEIEAAAA